VNSKHSFKLAAFLGIKLAAFLGIVCLLAVPSPSSGAVFLSVAVAPPVLPVYAQPLCPGPDYIWTPGYWAYGPDGYFWIPGTWVLAPDPGLLWTPGYWAFANGLYLWHAGYWGPHVGFYGGVNYGFGYFGVGFVGGMWAGGHFRYNTAVMHVDPAMVHNTYVDRTVIRNTTVSHASFNGPGGIMARPTAAENAAEREHHIAPTTVQTNHARTAGENRNNLVSVNHGRPATMATSRPAGAPANRAAVNPGRPAPEHAPARTAPAQQHQVPARPPVAANHAAAPQHNAPARTAPAQRRPEPARPSAAVNHPAAPPSRQEAAGRPAPQHAPARTAPAQQRQEPTRPSAAVNHPVPPPPHQEAAGRPAPQRNAPERPEERR
jgi:WXXGXW repeat (2 copies)